jgi:prefoldin subunit 4
VRYRVGDAFITMTLPACLERLALDGTALDLELGQMGQRMESMRADMTGLKAKLYAKFGKSINLER